MNSWLLVRLWFLLGGLVAVITVAAGTGLWAAVGAPVLQEGRAVAERLPALLTPVGSLLSVHYLVLEEVGSPAEGLPTLTALIGFLTGVHPVVLAEA